MTILSNLRPLRWHSGGAAGPAQAEPLRRALDARHGCLGMDVDVQAPRFGGQQVAHVFGPVRAREDPAALLLLQCAAAADEPVHGFPRSESGKGGEQELAAPGILGRQLPVVERGIREIAPSAAGPQQLCEGDSCVEEGHRAVGRATGGLLRGSGRRDGGHVPRRAAAYDRYARHAKSVADSCAGRRYNA